MSKFTVNGKEYKSKPFDFNFVCDLEDMGIAMSEMGKKHMSAIRAYFGLCAGMDNEEAGKEIEQHLIGGGTFDGITAAMNAEMEKSDFFRSLTKTAEEETTENQSEAEAEAE